MCIKRICCFFLAIFFVLLLSAEVLASQSNYLLNAYIWGFSNADKNSKKWEHGARKRFTDDFRTFLIGNDCLSILEREQLDRLLSHLKMEKEIRRLEEIPATNLEALNKIGANVVIFGEIDDDSEGGEIIIKVVLQAFNHIIISEKQVQIKPNQRLDGDIRREKMKLLSKELCESINSNLDSIKNKLTQPSIKEKCGSITSEILSSTKQYDRLLLKENESNIPKTEVNIAIISELEGLINNYNSIEKCPGQSEDIKKQNSMIIKKYEDELLKRNVGLKTDSFFLKYENLKKEKNTIQTDNFDLEKKITNLEDIINVLKKIEKIYSEYPLLFPKALQQIRKDVDEYNNELIKLLKKK